MSFLKTTPATIIAAGISLLIHAYPAHAAAPVCGIGSGQKATGKPILVGSVTGRTGPDDMSSSTQAAAAYFDCVNANGGINGRPVEYLVEDDQWSPETARQVAQKLINDRKVVAMVGNSSYVDCGANASLYEQAGLLAVVGVGGPSECFTSPAVASANAGPRASGLAVLNYALHTWRTKNAVCINASIANLGAWVCKGAEEWGAKNGVKVTSILVDPGTADWTSTLLQATSLDPDTILIGFPRNTTVAILNAAEQQGLADKYHIVSLASGYSIELPQTIGPYWNDRFVANLEFAALDSQGPDNQNWLSVMDAYAAKSSPRDTFSQAGYISARILTETLLKLDPAKIDRQTVNAALRDVQGFKSDMLCRPWEVEKGGSGHNANHGGPTAVVKDGHWETVGACADD